jgi:hypothetical protein
LTSVGGENQIYDNTSMTTLIVNPSGFSATSY